jgi:hypothetical protein
LPVYIEYIACMYNEIVIKMCPSLSIMKKDISIEVSCMKNHNLLDLSKTVTVFSKTASVIFHLINCLIVIYFINYN